MPKVRVHCISTSLDGYAAGPDQTLENPFGTGGMVVTDWMFNTRSFRERLGMEGGEKGIDDDFFIAGEVNIGATIMGRNMFGPIRGGWGDEQWKGWWGDNPPYHNQVFVLTHHPRASIPMEGGTTFHFVTDGIESTLAQAVEAAGDKDVRIAGGASTVQQYLRAGLIDEMHYVISPVFVGAGERLFDNLDGGPEGYKCVELVSSPPVVHVRLARS